MIIVEGMDGSGKSGLVRRLSKDLSLPIHERAATSKDGPREDLFDWTTRDLDTYHQQPVAIYDRHPLISDFVYGPIVRHFMDERFYGHEGQALIRKFRSSVLVVFCDPGLIAMGTNVARTNDGQMSGVLENFLPLALAYRAFFAHYPGNVVRWDYNRPHNYDSILDNVGLYAKAWGVMKNV